MGAVEPEIETPGRDQVEQMKRRGAVGDRAQHTEVPLQHTDLQAGFALHEPGKKPAQPLRHADQRVIGIELQPRVELPADEHHGMVGTQQGVAQIGEIVGGIHDRCKAGGLFEP